LGSDASSGARIVVGSLQPFDVVAWLAAAGLHSLSEGALEDPDPIQESFSRAIRQGSKCIIQRIGCLRGRRRPALVGAQAGTPVGKHSELDNLRGHSSSSITRVGDDPKKAVGGAT
jgi:hypothetical protein